ncbi:transcription factor bHLH128 [Quercus lobata]|uniref:BHLH domain-containing protein n=1 Tax=Quercus lobata TaxID=97700 RepID=A0A7N2MT44_QUELO|nr:transcription factor bHLH128 [Quercus lobata]
MYPSSSPSSSSQKPMGPTPPTTTTGLTRYGSAPGSLLTTAVDSIIGQTGREFSALRSTPPPPPPSFMAPQQQQQQQQQHHHHHHHNSHSQSHHYFSSDSSSITTESTCKVNSSNDPNKDHHKGGGGGGGLQRSYGLNEMPSFGDFTSNLKIGGAGLSSSSSCSSSSSASALVRQRSSPAGFLSHLASDNGFSVTRGSGGYASQGGSNGGHGVSRLKSQLSFTRQDSLSQISEVSEDVVDGISSDNGHQNASHSYATSSFGMDSWDNANSIIFSAPPSKRAKNLDGDIYNCLNGLETQFSLPQTTLEMATVEKLLHIPEDSVPCKIRAKRGCATHPRSIAERERRTRISGKLKKLQDLVPNMDKQTSYADMLDLAVQHIKGLQNQVQKLRNDLDGCTCGCNQTT